MFGSVALTTLPGRPTAPRPSLQAAWNLFAAHWRAYLWVQLTLVGLAFASMLLTFLVTLIAVALTAGVAPEQRESITTLVQSALNLPFTLIYQVLAGLVGVLLPAFPALYFSRGTHPGFGEGLALLRARPARYVLAGLLVALAGFLGLLLCLVPGLIVMAVTPIVIRRIFTTDQPVWPAFLASFRDFFGSPHSWGLVGYELLALVLIAISALFCLLPLLVTVPLAAIFIQQYLAAWGLGAEAAPQGSDT